MAEPSFPTISTPCKRAYRPVVKSRTTRLEVMVDLDGAAATLSSPMLYMARGSEKTGVTAVVSGTKLYADITANAISGIGLDTFGIGSLSWECAASGFANTLTFTEAIWVSDKELYCPLSHNDLLTIHPILGNVRAYPIDPRTGVRQTTWTPQIRLAWAMVWNELFQRGGPAKAPHLIHDTTVLWEMVLCKSAVLIGGLQITAIDSRIWEIAVEAAAKRLEYLLDSTTATYETGKRNSVGEQPATSTAPVMTETLLTGEGWEEDFGKL